MEQNTNRMWWTIGLIVLGGLLISGLVMVANANVMPKISEKANTLIKTTDPDVTHTAYAWSSDGTDRFTTTKPNLNLLDGTKDFSGDWYNSWFWENDGTYEGLAVKKKVGQWGGIYKTFTAPKDGDNTFSAYVKSSGSNANIERYVFKNGEHLWNVHKELGSNFDWLRDSLTLKLKAGDKVTVRYEIAGSDSNIALWTAGHKWEEGSVATPYMPSASEVKPSDQPKYIGTYTDKSKTDSQDPKAYTWKLNPEYHE